MSAVRTLFERRNVCIMCASKRVWMISDQLFVTLYALIFIYSSVHKQLIRYHPHPFWQLSLKCICMSKTCNYPIMSSRRDNVYFLLDKSVRSVCSMNFNFAYVHMSCLHEKVWINLINTVPADILFQNLRIPEEEKISVETPVKIF